MSIHKKLYTVWVFFKINLRRVFRDRGALFFTFLFPLIFLFVFGSISGNSSAPSFHIALINKSNTPLSKQFLASIKSNKVFKLDTADKTISEINTRMQRGELDALIEVPADFGKVPTGKTLPEGDVIIRYTQNTASTAETIVTIMTNSMANINAKFVPTKTLFVAEDRPENTHSLKAFDYTFTGMLGFAILGVGIFGPINVFPELKKMGILRRLHTTPLRVWQYFLSVMLGNAAVGLMSLSIMFVAALTVFHLHVVGNLLELAVFLALSIIMVLGLGLAIGGWAKNERQAAPLANIVVFPMMFLTGTFFPRYLMPGWLQSVTNYIPLSPVIDGSRLILTEGYHLWQLGPQLAVMAVWLIIIYPIAFKLFRWE